MKMFHHDEITKIKMFAVELLSRRAAALMCITMIMLMSVSFGYAADTDLDIWNSIINSQTDTEACSNGSDDCAPSKKELNGFQYKKPDDNKVSLKKQESAVKAPAKTKKKAVVLNEEKADIKNNLKSPEKQETSRLKTFLPGIIGAAFGFMFIWFYRKRRKNDG